MHDDLEEKYSFIDKYQFGIHVEKKTMKRKKNFDMDIGTEEIERENPIISFHHNNLHYH